MDTNLTVLLAGASGVFGRHVTGTLRAAGYRVLGLGRGPANEVRADLLDRDGLLRAVRDVRADVVVHAATALRKPPTSHRGMYGTDELRIAGTANLLEAAGVVGARRFVGENIVFGYGYRDFGDRVRTEDDPFGDPDPDKGIARHVEAMRQKAQLPLAVPGLHAVSLRYGLFYGAAPPSRRPSCCAGGGYPSSTTTVTCCPGSTWPTPRPRYPSRSSTAGPAPRTTSPTSRRWASARC